jgi:hypothetical protein
MTPSSSSHSDRSPAVRMLTDVPEITAVFWLPTLLTTGKGRGDVERD